jgi:acetyl-CoA carboxylase carboxyl transferase subunit alpha
VALARLEGEPVVIIGHQKGRDTIERVWRNYGMARPEGYRKALRLMNLAQKFEIPLITLIDTAGAYPASARRSAARARRSHATSSRWSTLQRADRLHRDRRRRLRRARSRSALATAC